MKYLLILSATAALFSCTKTIDYPNEIAQLDSTETVLNEALQNILNFTNEEAKLYKSELDFYHNEIMPHYQDGDTNAIWTNEVTDLNFCRKMINNYLDQKQGIEDNIKTAHKQVADLKHDLENNLVADTAVASFVNVELSNAASHYNQYNKRVKRALGCFAEKDSVLSNAKKVLNTID